MKGLMLICGLLVLTGCSEPVGVCDPLVGYYYDYGDESPELPSSVVDTVGSFDIIIERLEYRALVRKAETLFPPASEILGYRRGQDGACLSDEPLWWYTSFDGVRIPYAVTASAVAYYLNLIYLYREGDFDGAGTLPMIYASLEYHAKVHFWQTFITDTAKYDRVYVVEQELRWGSYCGMLCGLWFTKRRFVIFSEDTGALLGIIGDGVTGVVVS